ncbi:MAG TPA: hypothetical protein VGC35_09295 [Allosphingosinicella sp.]|jgi:hypothetical protein
MTTPALYPCYVDLDSFIDVKRLTALDDYVRERLEQRLRDAKDLAFYTGPFLLDGRDPHLPGSRLVYLSQSAREQDYYDLDRTDLWRPTGDAELFAELMSFIDTLPFEAKGRMIIMYDDSGRPVSAHRDHDSADLCHEFVWFRTNLGKPFYMLNPETGEKLYVGSHAAWFDTVNQYHGADGTGGLSFSIRVDGRFSPEFRRLITFPEGNRAAAAALWDDAVTV